jgi:diaminopimelate epimerase
MAKFLYEKGYVDEKEVSLQTKGGEVRLYLEIRGKKVGRVRERMLEPEIKGIKKLDVDGKSIEAFLLSLGNPHAVIFEDLSAKAERIEEIFNGNINVEFAEIISPSRIKLKVYERGAGFTLACGTGACASVFAGYRYKGIADKVEVSLPGGSLDVEVIDDRVYMSSEPAEVFKGEIENDC